MLELSNERIQQILHEETTKTEEVVTILRSIYTRYMRLYEKYFEDIDLLNDDKIAELRKYHEETLSLTKYYYLDIPQDICTDIKQFEEQYGSNLLGPNWYMYVFGSYEDWKSKSKLKNKDEKYLKAQFTKETLEAFYEAMDYIFRDGFGTGSETAQTVTSGITGLLFGKDQ